MIDILLIERSADTRASADVLIERSRLAEPSESAAERMVRTFSRFAGIAAFIATLGATLVWLVR